MSKPIGVTIHHEDKSTLKVGIPDLAAAFMALETAYRGANRGGGKYQYINADECPVHGPWKAVPGGVSKSTGNPYRAFWTCDTEQGEERCTNKPSREWVETHPPERGDASQVDVAPRGTPASSAEDFDELPF